MVGKAGAEEARKHFASEQQCVIHWRQLLEKMQLVDQSVESCGASQRVCPRQSLALEAQLEGRLRGQGRGNRTNAVGCLPMAQDTLWVPRHTVEQKALCSHWEGLWWFHEAEQLINAYRLCWRDIAKYMDCAWRTD